MAEGGQTHSSSSVGSSASEAVSASTTTRSLIPQDVVDESESEQEESQELSRAVLTQLKQDRTNLKRNFTNARRALCVAIRNGAADDAQNLFHETSSVERKLFGVLLSLQEEYGSSGSQADLTKVMDELEELGKKMETSQVEFDQFIEAAHQGAMYGHQLQLEYWGHQGAPYSLRSRSRALQLQTEAEEHLWDQQGQPELATATGVVTPEHSQVTSATNTHMVSTAINSGVEQVSNHGQASVVSLPPASVGAGSMATSSTIMSVNGSKLAGSSSTTTSVPVYSSAYPISTSGVSTSLSVSAMHRSGANPTALSSATRPAMSSFVASSAAPTLSNPGSVPSTSGRQMMGRQSMQQATRRLQQQSMIAPPPANAAASYHYSQPGQQPSQLPGHRYPGLLNNWTPHQPRLAAAQGYSGNMPPMQPNAMSYLPENELWGHLEKFKLPKFDGNKRDYSSWKAAFEACVEKAKVTPELKLLQLRNHLTGDALKAISGLGYSAGAYQVAINRLERKYGGRRRQIALHLEAVEAFPVIRQNHHEELEKFADLLDVTIVNLKDSGQESELSGSLLFAKLQAKLPVCMIRQYHRWCYERRLAESVESLLEWTTLEAEFATSAAELVYGVNDMTARTRNRPPQQRPQRQSHHTFIGAGASSDSVKCAVCSHDHKVWKCPVFLEQSIGKRWATAKKAKLCYRCLGAGHNGSSCSYSRRCGVNGCVESHNSLLHSTLRSFSGAVGQGKPAMSRTSFVNCFNYELITIYLRLTDYIYNCLLTVLSRSAYLLRRILSICYVFP